MQWNLFYVSHLYSNVLNYFFFWLLRLCLCFRLLSCSLLNIVLLSFSLSPLPSLLLVWDALLFFCFSPSLHFFSFLCSIYFSITFLFLPFSLFLRSASGMFFICNGFFDYIFFVFLSNIFVLYFRIIFLH